MYFYNSSNPNDSKNCTHYQYNSSNQIIGGTNFLGKLLGGPPYNVDGSGNPVYYNGTTPLETFHSVENEYLDQHELIYDAAPTTDFPYIENVSVRGMVWLKSSCVKYKTNFPEKSNVDCRDFTERTPLQVNFEVKKQESLLCFPNPNSGSFTIQTTDGSKIQEIILLDITGKIIKHYLTVNSPQLEIETQYKGLLFIQVASNNQFQTIKTIVQ